MKKVMLSIRNLTQSYGEKKILKGLSLDIFEGETVVILGSSGCGKTSLLKAVAGLIPIEEGAILLDGTAIDALPPQERRAAMIFQNYALFPHMSVIENLEYGLKIKGIKKQEMRKSALELLTLLKMDGLEDRAVSELSGGQQQRVAIGRAMIVEPAVMLFDEPLSNLDENLRKSMRQDIKRILRSGNRTSLYVTHDQVEAMAMADRIIVMNHGEIEQIALPGELYRKPRNEYVARFLGFRNIFEVEKREGRIRLFGHSIELPVRSDFLRGSTQRLLIRPEDIEMDGQDSGAEPSHENLIILRGVVKDTEFQISLRSFLVATDYGNLYVNRLNRSVNREPDPGDEVFLSINTNCFHYFEDLQS